MYAEHLYIFISRLMQSLSDNEKNISKYNHIISLSFVGSYYLRIFRWLLQESQKPLQILCFCKNLVMNICV